MMSLLVAEIIFDRGRLIDALLVLCVAVVVEQILSCLRVFVLCLPEM